MSAEIKIGFPRQLAAEAVKMLKLTGYFLASSQVVEQFAAGHSIGGRALAGAVAAAVLSAEQRLAAPKEAPAAPPAP